MKPEIVKAFGPWVDMKAARRVRFVVEVELRPKPRPRNKKKRMR